MTTRRDVIDALLRGRDAPRVGLRGNPWPETIPTWIEQGYPTDADGEPVDPVEHFQWDMGHAYGWWDMLPLRGQDEIIEETDEWKVVRNGAGAALKWWKHKSGTPEHVDFTMTSREIWERDYRPHLLELDPGRVDVERAREGLKRCREQGVWAAYDHRFIFENLRSSLGDVCMYESVLLDPDWIHDYNRVHTDFYKAHYAYLLEHAGLPDGIWVYEDLGYKNSLFMSPKVLGELFFPYFAEVVEFFHGYDLPVVLHTCGYTEPAIDMVVEAGFDALNPLEVKAGNDALRIADRWAEDIAFIGGFDSRILEGGDRALIKREIETLVEGMKARGARFVFTEDHSLSPLVAYDDYCYAMDVYRARAAY
jgi:uroporphyrinogen decarboxylase